MWESTTYQAILREGRQEGVIEGRAQGRIAGEQRMLLRQGTKRFGEPDPATLAAIEAIQDIDRLEALAERMIDPDLQGWDDLLRLP
jgi:predicted transposase YdaD